MKHVLVKCLMKKESQNMSGIIELYPMCPSLKQYWIYIPTVNMNLNVEIANRLFVRHAARSSLENSNWRLKNDMNNVFKLSFFVVAVLTKLICRVLS